MRLELFLFLVLFLLYLSVNGYLEKMQRLWYSMQMQGTIGLFQKFFEFFKTYTLTKLGLIFVLCLIFFPSFIKFVLSPFAIKKSDNPVELIHEYNFVNSVRTITDNAKKKNENWVKSREDVIINSQNGKCNDCFMDLSEARLHHKIPLHRGGTNDLSNLQALCTSCAFKRQIQENLI